MHDRLHIAADHHEMLTLHVTNGDSAATGLARSGVAGEVLPWRDVLHDGPVIRDDDRSRFRAMRADFLSGRQWAGQQEVMQDMSDRDARLTALGAEDAVVLWFEPDVYDQLQLIEVLSLLCRQRAQERPTVSIVPADLMLGPLSPNQFLPLYDARRTITTADLQRGHTTWLAYSAASPDDLESYLDEVDRTVTARTYGENAQERLPHLTGALRRVLEEYPDLETGLSRSERQICEALATGPSTLAKLFTRSHHASESWVWLGDLSFAWYVDRLSEGPRPLVLHRNGTRVIAPRRGADARGFWERSVELTPFGEDVVRARADAIAANGIDRWIGGAHLTTARHWRWDGHRQRTVLHCAD